METNQKSRIEGKRIKRCFVSYFTIYLLLFIVLLVFGPSLFSGRAVQGQELQDNRTQSLELRGGESRGTEPTTQEPELDISQKEKPTGKEKSYVWFRVALVISALYMFIALYYFHENYLLPYIKDLERGVSLSSRNLCLWMMEWILPALALQLFVVTGFWLTVDKTPFTESLYTHPYMYGQIYSKMENQWRSEKKTADQSNNLKDANTEEELKQRAISLEAAFAAYIKNHNPSNGETEDNARSISEMRSTIYKIPYLIALTFGFLGTLIYTLNDTAYRFYISDLYPKTYVNYLIRFIFAPAMCLVIAYSMMDVWIASVAPLIFFSIGLFPQRGLRFIDEKSRAVLGLKKEEIEKQRISLGQLQGMTDYILYRLKEFGIEDVQNLAYADINYLRKNWFNERQLCDFIAQAVLMIHIRENFAALQNNAIRNIIVFKNIVNENNYNNYAEKIGIVPEKLRILLDLIKMPSMAERIKNVETIMNNYEQREMYMGR